MAETHLRERLSPGNLQLNQDDEGGVVLRDAMNAYSMQHALNHVWADIQALDLFIQENEPYKKVKSENEQEVKEALEQIGYLTNRLYHIAAQLACFMPETSAKICEAVQANKKPENLFPRLP